MGKRVEKKESIILVLKDAATGRVERVVKTEHNIVTNAGDLYYAQRGATLGALPTHTFYKGMMVVAQSGIITAKTRTFGAFKNMNATYTGRQSFATGYPKTNDSDTDNTGRTTDSVTYKRVYTTAQANYTIRFVGICRHNATTNSNGQLLSYKSLTPGEYVTKTSTQTLTAYINHNFLGV